MSLAGLLWPYAERTIERLVATFEEIEPAGRVWVPSAPDANSIAALTSHTLSNAAENLLHTICGQVIDYPREADFDQPELDPGLVRTSWTGIRTQFVEHLALLDDEHMLAVVHHPRRGEIIRIEVLVIVARHASEHLAQVELTRDLFLQSRRG